MRKNRLKALSAMWERLNVGVKLLAASLLATVIVAGITIPAYRNRQALIHSEQQASIEAEQDETVYLADEQAAARIEAERMEAEKMSLEQAEAEEAQARLEAEAEAQARAEQLAEQLAAEEAAVASQAPSQVQPAVQQPAGSSEAKPSYTGGPEGAIGDPMTGPVPSSEATSWSEAGEPLSGNAYNWAQYCDATWYPDRARWEYTSAFGITRAIYPDGHTEILDAPEPTSGEGKVQAERMGAVWVPEWAGWVYYSDLGKIYVRISEGGGSAVLSGEEITLAKRYIQ